MTTLQKQRLFDVAADKLKLASHFAESMRNNSLSIGNASTMNKLASEASAAAKDFNQAMLGYEKPKVG